MSNVRHTRCTILISFLSKVVVVAFPATSLTTGRTRICISAGHTREDLEYAVDKLEEVVHKCFLRYGNNAMGA